MAGQNDLHVCSICLNDFTIPKIIDCHHTFCEQCLKGHIKKSATDNNFLCPLCRQEIRIPKGGVKEFPMNFYIRERSLDLSSCGICKTKPCVFNCRNCEQYLCRPCKTTHDALADNNNHVIFTLDGHSGSKLAPKTYCKIHRRQEVRVFCNDCTVAVCQICLEQNHSSHFKSDLMEYLNEVGNELDINRTYMEDKLTQLKTDVNNINKSIRETRQNSNTECDKIDEHVELFYNILKHSRKGMKQDLKKIQDDYEDKIGKHKDGKEMMIKKLENCLNAMTKDLKNPCIYKMLTIARHVKSTKESITDTVDSDVSMPSLRLCKYQSGQLDGDTVSRVMGGLVYIHEFWANINGEVFQD